MSTLTITSENQNLISALKSFFSSLKGVIVSEDAHNMQATSHSNDKCIYRISERIRSLETGGIDSNRLSPDYKKELAEAKERRFS